MEMAEGLVTMYKNLREAVGKMDSIDATWLPIELDPAQSVANVPLARIPPFSSSWSLQRGLLARSCVHSLEESGNSFDAALFNSAPVGFFLRRFRHRVPSVDALDATPAILARYAYNRPRADGNPVVHHLRQHLIQNVFDGATRLLPWSRFAKDSLITDYRIPEKKISIVPPGINLKVWSRHTVALTDDGRSARKITVLFVGGNFARKGGDLLLNVAKREEFRHCDFHFVTKGFTGTSNGNVFVHKNLPPNSDALISLYQQADIFALPTRADVFSLASLEAMAMGLPVITTDVGGIGEIVTDGENGFLIPVDDERALLDRLRTLTCNEELRTRFGRNGRQLVEARFDLDTMAETIVDFLVRAAASKHKKSVEENSR
jgi:glycosyltransferase involved in cell wall biosynthesis